MNNPDAPLKHGLLILIAAVVGVAVSGCVTAPQKRTVEFDESQFAPYKGKGTGTITGQAFLKTRGGEVRFGAGCEVVMVPVTSYSIEIFERSVLGGQQLEPADKRYLDYRRTTRADGNGNFEFRDLPSGEYFLSCIITWEVPGAYGLTPTGGAAHARAKVEAGGSTKIIVTR